MEKPLRTPQHSQSASVWRLEQVVSIIVMDPEHFDESLFRTRVNQALEKMKTILDSARTAQLPSEVPHEYGDKYLLAELLVNNAISAEMQCLDRLGLAPKKLEPLKEAVKNRSVTLRLKAEETCKFLRKTVREVQSATTSVHESSIFGTSKSFTVTKVTEFFWAFDFRYDLLAFVGNDPDSGVNLQGRKGSLELKTSAESTPYPATVVRTPIDLNITWLLSQLDSTNNGKFSIDRGSKSCHTPRRNSQVSDAFSFMTKFYTWAHNVHSYFTSTLFAVDQLHRLDLAAINTDGIFVPVVPVLEPMQKQKKKKEQSSRKTKEIESSEKNDSKALVEGSSLSLYLAYVSGTTGDVVPFSYTVPFLEEQRRSFDEKFGGISRTFPSNDKIVTVTEAKLLVSVLQVQNICLYFGDGLNYIERMLYKQLVAAIGREVTSVDFSAYVRFHNRRLFRAEFQHRPFCYAVRRPGHTPEGTLSIEAQPPGGALPDPIATTVACALSRAPMRFSLDAATEVSFAGERFLHGWISHRFSGHSDARLSLVARARQFSSFILLVGSIASADSFVPKYGMIVQNKDDLRIPLMLETIPTPKQFRDAIESLSPEQQNFAKGFRSMQLESTLFGICVIQIKPQLEKLLNLPDDSLTKEIMLTEDLLKLFIEYQIPSDLLSYDGDPQASTSGKIALVRQYVQRMLEMIKRSRETEKKDAQLRHSNREANDDNMLLVEDKRDTMVSKMSSSISFGKGAVVASNGAALTPKKSPLGWGRSDSTRASDKMIVTRGADVPNSNNKSTADTSDVVISQRGKQSAEQKQQVAEKKPEYGNVEAQGSRSDLVDYTQIPRTLEQKMADLDGDDALRPTIITPGNTWTKKYQKALLADPETVTMGTVEQGTERNRAFDLLDALTKSGALSVDCASLHVLVAATHCFDKSLMNTLVQDNVNPIEKLERSSAIMASAIHQRPFEEMVVRK